jgi:hypothetical protein
VRCNVFSADERVVINAFVDVALLVSDQGPTRPGGEAVVEVAHEALLLAAVAPAARRNRGRPGPAAGALGAGATGRRLAARSARRPYLLRGGRLAAIDQWATRHPGELGPLECEFLEASRGLATRRLEAIRWSNRRLRTLAAGLALLLVAALVAGGLAVHANQRAQEQARLAQAQGPAGAVPTARQRGGTASRQSAGRGDPGRLQSLSLARDHSPQPSDALMIALGQVTHTSRP